MFPEVLFTRCFCTACLWWRCCNAKSALVLASMAVAEQWLAKTKAHFMKQIVNSPILQRSYPLTQN